MNVLTTEQLGAQICGLRLQNNLNQEQLARKVGTTRQTIARIENGEGEKVAFGTWLRVLRSLAHHFSIEQDRLVLPIAHGGTNIPDSNPLKHYSSWLED